MYSKNNLSTPYTYPTQSGWTTSDYQNALTNPAYYNTWGKTQLTITEPSNATVMQLPNIVDPMSYTIHPFIIYQDQASSGYNISSLASSVGLSFNRIIKPSESIAIPYSGNNIFYAQVVPIDESKSNLPASSVAGYSVYQDVSVTYSDIVTDVQNQLGITFNTQYMTVDNNYTIMNGTIVNQYLNRDIPATPVGDRVAYWNFDTPVDNSYMDLYNNILLKSTGTIGTDWYLNKALNINNTTGLTADDYQAFDLQTFTISFDANLLQATDGIILSKGTSYSLSKSTGNLVFTVNGGAFTLSAPITVAESPMYTVRV